MALPTTFRGSNILTFPFGDDLPMMKELQLDMFDGVATVASPFTGATDVYRWPGADMWTAQFTMPPLNEVQAAMWSAFLASCQGMAGVFFLGHPFRAHPRGTAKGQPVVSGTNASMAMQVSTSGWTPTSYGVLLPGDQIQIGYRLHVVTVAVDSDANGNATLSIWPSLRESPTDGDQVILAKPQGLWRLGSNKRSILTTENRHSTVTVQLMEAR